MAPHYLIRGGDITTVISLSLAHTVGNSHVIWQDDDCVGDDKWSVSRQKVGLRQVWTGTIEALIPVWSSSTSWIPASCSFLIVWTPPPPDLVSGRSCSSAAMDTSSPAPSPAPLLRASCCSPGPPLHPEHTFPTPHTCLTTHTSTLPPAWHVNYSQSLKNACSRSFLVDFIFQPGWKCMMGELQKCDVNCCWLLRHVKFMFCICLCW